MLQPNSYDYAETSYRVRMLSFDSPKCDKTLAVVSTQQQADALVDKYSEQYPHAYIDYVYSLWTAPTYTKHRTTNERIKVSVNLVNYNQPKLVYNMSKTSMSLSQGAKSLHVYRAMLTDSIAKYVLAYDDEDAAWQAYRLSKQLDKPLLNVTKHG